MSRISTQDKRVKDLTGKRFGRLVVERYLGSKPKIGALWLCQCGCTRKTIAHTNSLTSGHKKSCGCLVSEKAAEIGRAGAAHGKSGSPTYRTWQSMKRRCSDPKFIGYRHYGGRGIRVCKRWLKFENFLEDMGERPEGKTLDRIDVNGHYEPANCKWSTRNEQDLNRQDTAWVLAYGKRYKLADLAAAWGVGKRTILSRLALGWPIEAAVGVPVVRGRNQHNR